MDDETCCETGRMAVRARCGDLQKDRPTGCKKRTDKIRTVGMSSRAQLRKCTLCQVMDHADWLSACSRVLLKKLIVTQLLKRFPTF